MTHKGGAAGGSDPGGWVYSSAMRKWRMFLTFLTIVLSIMGGVHWYLFARLVRETAIPSPWSGILGVALLVAVICIPLSFIAGRVLDKNVARYFVVPVYVWLGFAFQTFFLLLAIDVLRGSGWVVRTIFGIGPIWGDPAEALLAWRVLAGTATGATLLATGFAIWWGLSRMVVNRVEIPLTNLPPELDGFTIAQLSDLHLDLVHGRDWLASVVKKTNALQPDLIAITGDLAEGSVAQFGMEVEPLRELIAPHGVFFVTGNHEYFHDLRGWLRLLDDFGIRVLRNERVRIGGEECFFDLAGVDDHDGGRIAEGHGPDLQKALKGRDPDQAVVLLAHQPRIMEEASRQGVGLVLSGHTHGGQIWPFSYLVYLQQPYVRGLKELGNTKLYLSSGTGFWGPPMRLGTTAEIALITLRTKPTTAASSP
ncbi:MAG: metallophosphoesterase [Longimicrobiales bacterium]|nr:metallophosphoesterase [Longimicrobiales bacterium]